MKTVLCAGTGDSQMQILPGPGHLGAHRVEDGRWRQNCVFVGLKFKQLGGGAGRGSLRKRIQNYLIFANFAKF